MKLQFAFRQWYDRFEDELKADHRITKAVTTHAAYVQEGLHKEVFQDQKEIHLGEARQF